MYYMFVTKEGVLKGRGTGAGGPFTLDGNLKEGKRLNMQLANEENDATWDLWGTVSQKGYRMDIDDDTDYWYVVPENT